MLTVLEAAIIEKYFLKPSSYEYFVRFMYVNINFDQLIYHFVYVIDSFRPPLELFE